MNKIESNLSKSVLLVDDSELTLLLNKLMFEKLGYTVELASSAPLAIAAVRRSHFDFIVLDFHMPTTDGSECARLIRKQIAFNEKPSILIASTSDQSAETKARFLEAGTQAFIAKPMSLNELKSTLDSFSAAS